MVVACLDTVRVVSEGGSVRQPAGSGRAVAVATWSGTGGGGALGTVRVSTGSTAAVTLRGRRVARRRGRRPGRVRIGGRAAGFRADRLRVRVGRIARRSGGGQCGIARGL